MLDMGVPRSVRAGPDLTQSKHYAINEDSAEYDDDVGGPAFVAGDDGVELIAAVAGTGPRCTSRGAEAL